MSNTVVLNLDYTFVIDPKYNNNEIITCYETHNGIWRQYTSKSLSSSSSSSSNTGYKMIDNLYPLQQLAQTINDNAQGSNNRVKVLDPSIKNPLIMVSIQGDETFINDARHQILINYNRVGYKTLTLNEIEFMNINETFTDEMMKLCQRYEVEIIINNDINSFGGGDGGKQKSATTRKLEEEQIYSIHIVGKLDNITFCETSMRILIDSILNGYTIDCIDMELSMIPILGGIDLFNFHQIAKQTKANIYVPDLLPNLFNSQIITNNKDLKIWITAKNITELLLAKFILNKLIQNNNNNNQQQQQHLIMEKITMNKNKLDLMILNNQKNLLNIMFKYGVFIQLPNLGELKNSTILVQGCIKESVDDCVSDINGIATDYYTVDVVSPSIVNNNKMGLIQLMQQKKTCNVVMNEHGLQFNGRSDEIKLILKNLATNGNGVGNGNTCLAIKLRLELGNDQRDFISGKKNGKLIKILNQLQNIPKINFQTFNQYNFYIDIEVNSSSQSVVLILKTLDLLELELPLELKFNIPEVFHKSIIGNGGSIIQSIMKKYNVFIKFSSTKISSNNTNNVYSLKRTNNVLIKCPKKNSKNIKLVKYEIDQLVYKCCMNDSSMNPITPITTVYHSIKFQLLKSHYLMLINNNKLGQITKLENDYQSFINFPSSIEDFKTSDNKLLIDMKGSESKVKHCAKQLKKILPNNYEFKVTFNPNKFNDTFVINKQDFENQIVIPFKILLGIEIIANETPIESNSNTTTTTTTNEQYHQFILSYFNENEQQDNINLDKAIVSLTLFLRERGFLINEKREMEFNPLIEPVVSSSPVKLQQSLFNPISPLPLQSITNFIDMKTATSPKGSVSPKKNSGQLQLPVKLQFLPNKSNNHNNNRGSRQHQRNQSLCLPVKQQQVYYVLPVKQQQAYYVLPTKQQQQQQQGYYLPTKQQQFLPSKMQQYQYQQQYQYSPIKQPNFQQFYIPSPTETLVPTTPTTTRTRSTANTMTPYIYSI